MLKQIFVMPTAVLLALSACPEQSTDPPTADTAVQAETAQETVGQDTATDDGAGADAATETKDTASPDSATSDSAGDLLSDTKTDVGDSIGEGIGDGDAEVGPTCASDDDCEDVSECRVGKCDLSTGACLVVKESDDTPCTNPDPACVESAVCTGGSCVPTKKPSQCGDKVCGLDACNNSCGICPIGETCDLDAGTCTDPAAACVGIDFFGCCTGDGVTLVYCLEGALVEETCGPATACGYEGSFGFFCTADPIDVPAGTDYACPGETCSKTCDDVECGNVCGQTCSACPSGTYCNDTNACKGCGCDPTFECGEDPCGTSCGTCTAPGSVCMTNHKCSAPTADGAPDSAPDASTDSGDGSNSGGDLGPEASGG